MVCHCDFLAVADDLKVATQVVSQPLVLQLQSSQYGAFCRTLLAIFAKLALLAEESRPEDAGGSRRLVDAAAA